MLLPLFFLVRDKLKSILLLDYPDTVYYKHAMKGLAMLKYFPFSKDMQSYEYLEIHYKRKKVRKIWLPFKGKVAWNGFFAHCILSRCCATVIFAEIGQVLTHLAHMENTQSEIFMLGRLKILIAFCFLRALMSDAIWHGWNIDLMKTSQIVEKSWRTLQIR